LDSVDKREKGKGSNPSLSAIFFSALLCCALIPALAADVDPRPKVLAASFFHALRLEGAALVYYSVGRKEILPSPTPRQWREFRRRLDEAGVWSWKPKYERSVTDASGWKLHVEYADRSLRSEGYAAIPDLNSYMHCVYALQELTGRQIDHRRVQEIELYDTSELTLVATHPSKNPREQWADLRDPRGKVHRVRYDPDAPNGYSYLAKVSTNDVTLGVMDHDGSDFVIRFDVIRLSPGRAR